MQKDGPLLLRLALDDTHVSVITAAVRALHALVCYTPGTNPPPKPRGSCMHGAHSIRCAVLC